MKFAWVENDCIRDVCDGSPAERFHPDVAVFYDTQVPNDAKSGDGWVNGALVKPAPPVAAAPEPRTWGAGNVREGLTLAERVKWDNDESNTIKTAKLEMATPQELAHTTEVLQLLVDTGDISAESMSKILA